MNARTANHTYNAQSFILMLDLLRLLRLPRHSTGLIPSKKDYHIIFNIFLLLKSLLSVHRYYIQWLKERNLKIINYLKVPLASHWCHYWVQSYILPPQHSLGPRRNICLLLPQHSHFPPAAAPWTFFRKVLLAVAWVVLSSLPRPEWIFIDLDHSTGPFSWPPWLVQGWTQIQPKSMRFPERLLRNRFSLTLLDLSRAYIAKETAKAILKWEGRNC